MWAVPMHEPDPPVAVAKDHQILAQYPECDRQLGDLGGHRHRMPEPPQVLPARRAGADADELPVGLGRGPDPVAPVPALGDRAFGPAQRLRDRRRAARRRLSVTHFFRPGIAHRRHRAHRRLPTTRPWKVRTESSQTGESTPPPAATSEARPCWSRSHMA